MAVLVVYLFAYFGGLAEPVANLFGFTGAGRLIMNVIFWGLSAVGLWFAMGRARKLSLRDKAGEIYERAKRHRLKPAPPGSGKPLLSHQQTPGTSERVPSPSEYSSEAGKGAGKVLASGKDLQPASVEEVEDLGMTRVVIRQTIYGKARVYLKDFKAEETVEDSVEIRKGPQ